MLTTKRRITISQQPDMALFTWADNAHNAACREPATIPHVPGKAPAAALPNEFHAVARILQNHRGASSAITAEQIAKLSGLWKEASRESRRCKVRAVIREHMLDFDYPISGDSNGYYIANTADELQHYHASMHSRIRKIAIRMRSFIRQGKAAGFVYHGKGRWSKQEGTPMEQ